MTTAGIKPEKPNENQKEKSNASLSNENLFILLLSVFATALTADSPWTNCSTRGFLERVETL